MNLDASIWTTADGHRYVSVPAAVPVDWKQTQGDSGLVYVSGAYSIRRDSYGRAGWIYTVLRDGIELSLAFYSRLKDAKARAVENAEGRDVVNVA